MLRPQLEPAEGQVRRRETTSKRTRIIRLWKWDLLVFDLGGPELIDRQGLSDSVWCKMGIRPGDGGVAIEF